MLCIHNKTRKVRYRVKDQTLYRDQCCANRQRKLTIRKIILTEGISYKRDLILTTFRKECLEY